MAIEYRNGDLFDAHEQTIVNTVNCYGVMGKGIALEFKKRYPAMFRDYVERCSLPDGSPRKVAVGRLYVYEEAGRLILNFPTKKHWRFPSRSEYIEQGLAHFRENYHAWGVASIAFPRLGCENGGLDWETQVKPLMERYLSGLDIPLVVVTRTEIVRDGADRRVEESERAQLTLPGMDGTAPRRRRGSRRAAQSSGSSSSKRSPRNSGA
jgi:O-acetyl-ADP-ribose deacetylase (regulator of RNase III)